MTDAPIWNILSAMRSQLSLLPWDVADTTKIKRPASVVIRRARRDVESAPESMPCLVLTAEQTSRDEVENCCDQATYMVLVQILDVQPNMHNDDHTRTWYRWHHQISTYLSQSNLRLAADTAVGTVQTVVVGASTLIEPETLSTACVSYVPAIVTTKESRNPEGRV